MKIQFPNIAIVGTGAMGRGIAQIAAQAGSQVFLLDANPGAADAARAALQEQWNKLVAKGRIEADQATALTARLHPVKTAADLAACDLVVEAIVERLDAKQALFVELEGVVRADAVLATNTSSLSVTAIGAALKRPERLAGFHFFNPVPLMKVVEVIAGLKTDPAICTALAAYAKEMGHTPVQAQDTPGFIVNHAGRGFGTEALRIVGEGVADFATIDRILRDQVGFKLGPFELMDLTALDVSHPVMESIYRQYYDEPRFRPSVITAQRLAGAWWARRWAKASIATWRALRRCLPRRLPPWSTTFRRCGCPRALHAGPSCTNCSRTWGPPSRPANPPPPGHHAGCPTGL